MRVSLEPSTGSDALLRQFANGLVPFGAPREETVAVVLDLDRDKTAYPRRADLTAKLSASPEIVITGWACTMRPDPKLTRQIFGFVLPGDVLGSFWRRPDFTFCRLMALTPMTTAPAAALLARGPDGRHEHPELVRAARRAEDHAHHRLLDHVMRLGARDAYAGLAHLLLELHARLERVGMAYGGAFHLPVGQRVLAQAMGFSVVHINQTLLRMAADGLFAVQGDRVQLLQPQRMAALAGFVAREPRCEALEDSAMERLDHEPEVHHHDQRT